jgi:hypothetical protein
MRQVAVNTLAVIIVSAGTAVPIVAQATSGGQYQAVKACALVAVAEVKKLAPWPAVYDKHVEEKSIQGGSLCAYPTVEVLVTQFQQNGFDAVGKDAGVERIAGVGDAAVLRNSDSFADLLVKAGPHLVNVQMNFGAGSTLAKSKAAMIEIGKAFATRLR